jgi:hypothetical protein
MVVRELIQVPPRRPYAANGEPNDLFQATYRQIDSGELLPGFDV